MKVCYDRKNDVVSLYFEDENIQSTNLQSSNCEINNNYSFQDAAFLILDMVDILDDKGNCVGFRVFNASSYYDIELLNTADSEELDISALKRPSHKVIAKVKGGEIIY